MKKTARFTVRQADHQDVKTIADFNGAMALETEGLSLDPERTLQGVTALVRHPEYGFYLVADSSAGMIGQSMVTYEWSDWRNGIFWWIQSVYVLPEFRNQGVFRCLLQEVERRAVADAKVCGLRLYVERENHRAQETYLHQGFQTTAYKLLEKDYVMHRRD